jgi:ribonuclease HI
MQYTKNHPIELYTDGSCHTQLCVGAWASIILQNENVINLSGVVENTTHNRMEILAVLKGLEFILEKINQSHLKITVVSDSQYVVGLLNRRPKFILSDYKTKSGNDIRNKDLVLSLFNFTDNLNIDFVKIKAHQKPTDIINYNNEVDKICRSLLRKKVNNSEI